MKSTRVLSMAVLALALVGTLAWLLLGDPEEKESALSLHEAAVEKVHADPAELDSGDASMAALPAVELHREAAEPVVAPPREWKLLVTGSVHSERPDSLENDPLAGAEVDVLVHDDTEAKTRSFGRHVTDERGVFSLEMEFDPSWMDPETGEFLVYIELQVWAPGHCSGEWGDGLDLNETEEHEFHITLSPGAEVSGFVYAADGSPVQASVYLDINNEQDDVTCEEDGSYVLNLEEGGIGSILARCENHGTARMENLEIDPAIRTRVPDLYLSGTGVLGGILINPSGVPIAGYSVLAVSEELVENSTGSPNTWSFLPGRDAKNLAAERGDGMLLVSKQTDSNGGFFFEGLRPGRYLVYARHGANELAIETKRELFTTGNLDIHLILAMHRLEVTVKGGAGTQDVYCRLWSKDRDPEFGDPRPTLLRPAATSPIAFSVDPGRTYIVGLHDENFRVRAFFGNQAAAGPWDVWGAEKRVKIEEGVYVTKVELDPRAERGNLIINIEDAQDSVNYGIQIRSMYSETPMHSGFVSPEELPLVIEIGAGKYRVDVLANTTLLHQPQFVLPTFGQPTKPVEVDYDVDSGWAEVVVREGGEHRLNFDFKKGGRLRLTIPMVVPVGSPVAPIENWSAPVLYFSSPGFDEFELENSRGERTRNLLFTTLQPQESSDPEAKPLGFRELNRPIPAGTYTLRWQIPGGELSEKRFEIREGELTTVHFESEQR